MNCPECKSAAVYLTSDPFRGKDIVCISCGTITPWKHQFNEQQKAQAEQDQITIQRMQKCLSNIGSKPAVRRLT